MLTPPDVLVLGAGGVLGEAWMMGVLAGIEDATGFDMTRCEYFLGTSAGAIVAAHLVAGRSPRRPSTPGTEIELAETQRDDGLAAAATAIARRAGAFAMAAAAPLAPLALGAARPGGALLRAAVLGRVEPTRITLDELMDQVERSGAHFDGRLRVVTVEKRSGRRVVFGRPGAPRATVAAAVAASCSVPWLFSPIEIGGRDYVDGGVWSPTNLDVAPAGRGTHVLCLQPTGRLQGSQTIMTVARAAVRSAVSLEALALRSRGAAVQTVVPSQESADAMGPNFMAREPRGRVLAAGYRQGLSLGEPS